jgi:hypothetical protein
MRSANGWQRSQTGQLADAWPADLARDFPAAAMLSVELGLYLLARVLPGRPARDAWTLFGGYPYAEAAGHARSPEERLAIRRARHYLWMMRRRRVWLSLLEQYARVPEELRGYLLDGPDAVPVDRSPARAAARFGKFEELLSSPPEFARRDIPLAEAGEYWFPVRDRNLSVTIPPELAGGPPVPAHDLAAGAPAQGDLAPATWDQLQGAARAMDGAEEQAKISEASRSQWADRLARVELIVRQQDGFAPGAPLEVSGLLHMVGMVGAGKSTLRDILTYWYVTSGQSHRRVTIVVGDVAEALAVTNTFRRIGIAAAPVLGQSTRERNIHRLHRRLATAGAPAVMSHDSPGFRYLSSACALDALRGTEADRALRVADAPCTTLYEPRDASEEQVRGRPRRPPRRGCPLWSRCPRYHGARDLVAAQVWVATPAGLVHSAVPPHQGGERIRYLELACRMSDLIIVDEADRVRHSSTSRSRHPPR